MKPTRSPNSILRRGAGPAAAAIAVLLVASCGSGGGAAKDTVATTSTQAASAAGVVLKVSGAEFAFSPMALKASAGKTTIRFTNKGATDHDFSITALKVHLTAKPGKSAEATVTLKPGTYKSFCSVPGHSQSGMHGTLTVS